MIKEAISKLIDWKSKTQDEVILTAAIVDALVDSGLSMDDLAIVRKASKSDLEDKIQAARDKRLTEAHKAA